MACQHHGRNRHADEQPFSRSILDIDFWVDGVWYPAVVDASFELDSGEVLAIVGESGSGKSTTALATMGLLPKNANVRGSIVVDGTEVVGLDQHPAVAARPSRIGDLSRNR
ncbi:MAG: ATP-binding cassette domain-containing protein [Ilumatobacteraceae bacterium]